jgi:hypothetical protein
MGLAGWLLAPLAHEAALAAEEQAGAQAQGPIKEWSGGAAIGVMGGTPDGSAFGLNFNADRFLDRNVSLGPLLQMGFTGDMTLVGLSGQAKYWADLPDVSDRLKLVLQGGVGFAHADLRGSDTSWLIPLGIGVDYRLDEKVFLTSTFMLNFTDLDLGRGNTATVIPAWTIGVRF